MWYVVIYLWVVNGLAIGLFGWDKLCARKKRWRIPERLLLWVSAAGGSPGALLARWMFNHKSRKKPFSRWLFFILLLQVAALYLVWTNGLIS